MDRLREEIRYLEKLQQKVDIVCPVNGLLSTPRLREKIGLYLKEGDLVCEVDAPEAMEAEIFLEEQEVAPVRPGQKVQLKVRALPFETLEAEVERIAPVAVKFDKIEPQGTVTVTCRLTSSSPDLRPGMSGYARVYCGTRPLSANVLRGLFRYFRTEFWW